MFVLSFHKTGPWRFQFGVIHRGAFSVAGKAGWDLSVSTAVGALCSE